MCDLCDGMSFEESLERLRSAIHRVGWALQAVGYAGDSDGQLPWAYTIGLSAGFGHPELIVCGGSVDGVAHLLNAAGERIRDGEHLGSGDVVSHHGLGFLVRSVHPSQFASSTRFAGWRNYYDYVGSEPERRALQLLVPREAACTCHRQPDLALPAALTDDPSMRRPPPGRRPPRRPRSRPHVR